jgi:hypothetical protein
MSPAPRCAARLPSRDACRVVDVEGDEIIAHQSRILTVDSHSEEGLIACINARGEPMTAAVHHYILWATLAHIISRANDAPALFLVRIDQ